MPHMLPTRRNDQPCWCLLRAGARVTEESSFLATCLMNFAFVLHVFAFAAVIGVMSEEIKSKVGPCRRRPCTLLLPQWPQRRVRRSCLCQPPLPSPWPSQPAAPAAAAAPQLSAVRHGNIPLAVSGHVLVCNWNRQAPLLLRQMAGGGHGDSRTLGRQGGAPAAPALLLGVGLTRRGFAAAPLVPSSCGLVVPRPAALMHPSLPPSPLINPLAGTLLSWQTGRSAIWMPRWSERCMAAGCTGSPGARGSGARLNAEQSSAGFCTQAR